MEIAFLLHRVLLPSVPCLTNIFFHIITKRQDFRGEKNTQMWNVLFDFSLQHLSETRRKPCLLILYMSWLTSGVQFILPIHFSAYHSGRAVQSVGLAGSNSATSVSCECCVLSGRGLCDGSITRPEESYRVWWIRVGSLRALAPRTKKKITSPTLTKCIWTEKSHM